MANFTSGQHRLLLSLCLVAMAFLAVRGSKQKRLHYSKKEFGSLVLCPPGGRSFMMAWSLACEMKRRRKRSTLIIEMPDEQPPQPSIDIDGSELFSRNTRAQPAAHPTGYRPATLTEIQKICCDVGCEIRDLLSYCDPFGPMNS